MALVTLAVAAVSVAACASVTSGAGSGSLTSAPGSTPAPSASSATRFPSASASTSPPPTTGSCPKGTDFCDDFSSADSGWTVGNEPRYYSNYDSYLGGTYRMGERTATAKTQLSPFDLTTVSRKYGVRVDVAAALGDTAPSSSYLGIVCWGHDAQDGNQAGFLFFVTNISVDVTLLDDTDGSPHTIAQQGGSGLVKQFPAVNQLSATCVQGRRAGGGTQAELELTLNGSSVLRTTYASSVTNYPWTAGPRSGLLVAGKGSDVFYDNFAVTGQ